MVKFGRSEELIDGGDLEDAALVIVEHALFEAAQCE